ncbi:hypothetical protein [Bacillus alkalicellulosilyticus]|uniref:hypothetical protein n=1 Tax=Alkalihalobacterium alkalicellulosilyticum TaxID=1912214 RepID=UPI000996772B|nr:hypothetical protein [Bacillus alkalicellulosilyticus]
MSYRLEFYEKLDAHKRREAVWDILCEVDKEFVPSLSARESSFQSELQVEVEEDKKPHSYFEEVCKQHFILAISEGTEELLGFMTFKSGYTCEELTAFSPSLYITTVCVRKKERNRGITRTFYDFIQSEQVKEAFRMPYVSTRTWSANHSHIHVLETIEFEVSERLPDHRGKGIDTIYFAKRV